MELEAFKGQDIKELSMIEVAHAVLEQNGEEMAFGDLLKEVQDFLQKSDEEIQSVLSRFYTDLNTDGSFIPLGNNNWGLRSWFAIDSVDEETISLDYFDDDEKVEEEIDDSDSPIPLTDDSDSDSDENFGKKAVEDIIYDDDDDTDDTDDEHTEANAYDTELAEVEVDAEIPENEVAEIDEDLDDDDDDDDEEGDNFK